MLAGQARDQEVRPGAAVSEGLVVDAGDRLHGLVEVDRFGDLFVVVGAEALGDHPRRAGFVTTLDVHAQREGPRPFEVCDHRGRVDPATEKHPDRHVGEGVFGDDFAEHRSQPFDRLVGVGHLGLGDGVPVAFDVQPPVPDQLVAGWELSDARMHRLGRRRVLVGQVVSQCGAVQLGPAQFEQCLDLRREGQAAGQLAIVERFDADAVTHGEQPARLGVPDREGEHPAQRVHASIAVSPVQVQQYLGVAVRDERTGQFPA